MKTQSDHIGEQKRDDARTDNDLGELVCRAHAGQQAACPPSAPNANQGELRSLRQQYVQDVKALAEMANALLNEGKMLEEVARALHAERRRLGAYYKNITPYLELERIRKRNLEKYGDELGPSIEFLLDRGKTWEQIIESAQMAGGKDLGY